MKKILAILSFCLATQFAYSQQFALGLGNGGLNIKSNHLKRVGAISRIGVSNITTNNWSVNPSLMGVIRIFDADNAKPYFGIGLGSSFGANNTYSYNAFIPVGVEVFPMGQKRFSITVESQVGFGTSFVSKAFIYSGFRGLLEFSFYFGKGE